MSQFREVLIGEKFKFNRPERTLNTCEKVYERTAKNLTTNELTLVREDEEVFSESDASEAFEQGEMDWEACYGIFES